jgi:hypothetical protein
MRLRFEKENPQFWEYKRFRKQCMRVYQLRSRKDHRRVDLISDALLFGRLWYDGPSTMDNAIGYAKFSSRSHLLME